MQTKDPITILLEPDKETLLFERLNTVRQLLNKMDLGPNDALVIRDETLLTPDRRLRPGDKITLRLVASRG